MAERYERRSLLITSNLTFSEWDRIFKNPMTTAGPGLPWRGDGRIVEALTRLRTTMPFPLRGFDTDNGSAFITETVLAYCTKFNIEFTRARPYRKNDQAWVEQKNGAVVRRLVGYRRLEGIAAAEALSRLYAASRLFVNFFQPSFKLAEKKRVGARVTKRYFPPETPCARLLQSVGVTEAMKDTMGGGTYAVTLSRRRARAARA